MESDLKQPVDTLRSPKEEIELRVQNRTAELAAAIASLRKEVETLRASEERYRIISDLTSDYAYCYRVEPDGTEVVEWVTRALTQASGHTIESISASGWQSTVHPDDLPAVQQHVARVRSGQPEVIELRMITRTGEVRWLRDYSYPLWDPVQQRVVRIYGASQDITERRRAEQAARGQTAALARSLSALTADTDLDAFLHQLLVAIAEQLEAREATLWFYDGAQGTMSPYGSYDGSALASAPGVPPPARVEDFPFWEELLYTGRPLVIGDDTASPAYRVWLSQRNVHTALIVPLLSGVQPMGFFTILCPVQRGYLPEEIELAQALAQQATLAVQLTRLAEQSRQSAVLEERNRIAREIHDTLAQGFTGIVVQLEAAEDVLIEKPQEAITHIGKARQLARESLSEARRSVRALRPQILERRDLPTALREVVEHAAVREEGRAHFDLVGSARRLSPDVEDNLLRIGQEALANALRHAPGSRVRVELSFAPAHVQLCVRDDGPGFDPGRRVSRGLGLVSMHERAERVGAQLRVTSHPGGGTTVAVLVQTPSDTGREVLD